MHRQGLGERHDPALAGIDRRLDLFQRPVRLAGEDPGGEARGILDPDAARAEVPPGLLEQGFRRGAVQVDAEAVREHELDPAERVAVARALAQLVGEAAAVPRPVDRLWIDHGGVAAPVAEQRELVVRQIVHVALDLRQDRTAGDARRHVPEGVDLQVGHLVAEDRRHVEGLADHDALRQQRLGLVDQLEREVGEVDEDVALAQVVGHPAPALQVEDDLLDPGLDRHVEGCQGLRADGGVDSEAVAVLHAFDRLGEPRVVEIGIAAGGRRVVGRRQVAPEPEALPQQADPGIGHAGLQRRARGDRLPAAAPR